MGSKTEEKGKGKGMKLAVRIFGLMVIILASGFVGWEFAPSKVVEVTRIKLIPEKVTTFYSYYPEGYEASSNFTLLSLEETIRLAHAGADNHQSFIEQGINITHNSYWRDAHESAAYWLSKFSKESK